MLILYLMLSCSVCPHEHKFDLLFCLDGATTPDAFARFCDFAAILTSSLEVGEQKTRIAALQFADNIKHEFPFDRYVYFSGTDNDSPSWLLYTGSRTGRVSRSVI